MSETDAERHEQPETEEDEPTKYRLGPHDFREFGVAALQRPEIQEALKKLREANKRYRAKTRR